jgi:hypothetical protein
MRLPSTRWYEIDRAKGRERERESERDGYIYIYIEREKERERARDTLEGDTCKRTAASTIIIFSRGLLHRARCAQQPSIGSAN